MNWILRRKVNTITILEMKGKHFDLIIQSTGTNSIVAPLPTYPQPYNKSLSINQPNHRTMGSYSNANLRIRISWPTYLADIHC